MNLKLRDAKSISSSTSLMQQKPKSSLITIALVFPSFLCRSCPSSRSTPTNGFSYNDKWPSFWLLSETLGFGWPKSLESLWHSKKFWAKVFVSAAWLFVFKGNQYLPIFVANSHLSGTNRKTLNVVTPFAVFPNWNISFQWIWAHESIIEAFIILSGIPKSISQKLGLWEQCFVLFLEVSADYQ